MRVAKVELRVDDTDATAASVATLVVLSDHTARILALSLGMWWWCVRRRATDRRRKVRRRKEIKGEISKAHHCKARTSMLVPAATLWRRAALV